MTQAEWSFAEFHEYVGKVLTKVNQCLAENLPLALSLDAEPEAIYVKSPELRIVYSNRAYQENVCNDSCVGGRSPEMYLHESLVPIARATDHIILAGSRRLSVDHFGLDTRGRSVMFRTEKHSLIGAGNANYAILGVTHIQSLLDSESPESTRHRMLLSHWSRFRQLAPSEKEIAVCIARGLSPSEIADLQGVSKRTIELHRTAILASLGLPQPVDLVKLLVRLQENGLEDLQV